MNVPKILLLNNRCPSDGVGRYAFSLFSALRDMSNPPVEFLSWHHNLFRGVARTKIPFKFVPYFAYEFLMENRIPKEYDLYHITNGGLMSNVLGKIYPSVVTVHDLIPFTTPRDPSDVIVRKIMTKNIPRAKCVICSSESTKHDLLKFLKINPNFVRVIHLGVNHNLFKPREKRNARRILGLPINKQIILHVGREESRKNVPTLIEAFSKLQKKFPKVILIRIGRKTDSIQQLIKTFEIENSVFYFHSISDKYLALFYNAADLFVFPSFYEGFGFPVLEAMSSRIPVVTSNRTSIPEIVGDSGICLDPFDIESFTSWMYDILSNKNIRAEFAQNAFLRSKIFSWEKCARENMNIYNEFARVDK